MADVVDLRGGSSDETAAQVRARVVKIAAEQRLFGKIADGDHEAVVAALLVLWMDGAAEAMAQTLGHVPTAQTPAITGLQEAAGPDYDPEAGGPVAA